MQSPHSAQSRRLPLLLHRLPLCDVDTRGPHWFGVICQNITVIILSSHMSTLLLIRCWNGPPRVASKPLESKGNNGGQAHDTLT